MDEPFCFNWYFSNISRHAVIKLRVLLNYLAYLKFQLLNLTSEGVEGSKGNNGKHQSQPEIITFTVLETSNSEME